MISAWSKVTQDIELAERNTHTKKTSLACQFR